MGKEEIEDVAVKYGRTRGYASKLALKYKRKPTLLREIIEKHQLAQQMEQQI